MSVSCVVWGVFWGLNKDEMARIHCFGVEG